MLNRLGFSNVMSWLYLKRFLGIVFVMVIFSSFISAEAVFDQKVNQGNWRGDFYFVIYWLFAAACGLLVVHAVNWVNSFTLSKPKQVWAILGGEEKIMLYQAYLNGALVRTLPDNSSANALAKLRYFRSAYEFGDSTVWKLTSEGKAAVVLLERDFKSFYAAQTSPNK